MISCRKPVPTSELLFLVERNEIGRGLRGQAHIARAGPRIVACLLLRRNARQRGLGGFLAFFAAFFSSSVGNLSPPIAIDGRTWACAADAQTSVAISNMTIRSEFMTMTLPGPDQQRLDWPAAYGRGILKTIAACATLSPVRPRLPSDGCCRPAEHTVARGLHADIAIGAQGRKAKLEQFAHSRRTGRHAVLEAKSSMMASSSIDSMICSRSPRGFSIIRISPLALGSGRPFTAHPLGIPI